MAKLDKQGLNTFIRELDKHINTKINRLDISPKADKVMMADGTSVEETVSANKTSILAIQDKLGMNASALEKKISILEAENEKLKVEQEQQNEEILVNMLANIEMFEMILGMKPTETSLNSKGVNPMVEVYTTLIIKGIKSVDDVPLVIREQVIERLKQLEVPIK